MKDFTPQKAFLGLISTGDKYAVLSWRGFASESKALWTFKDYIDRKWMRKYKVGGGGEGGAFEACAGVWAHVPPESSYRSSYCCSLFCCCNGIDGG